MMLKTKEKALTAEEAIRQIAEKEGVTYSQVRGDMITAIEIGYNNPDPSIRAVWKSISTTNDMPTPEELIAWAAGQIKMGSN